MSRSGLILALGMTILNNNKGIYDLKCHCANDKFNMTEIKKARKKRAKNKK